MSNFVETELKLHLQAPELWQEVKCALLTLEGLVAESIKQDVFEAHYYDTPTQALARNGLAYRVRREHEAWVATVKSGGSTTGGLHQRQEWNVAVDGPDPDISVFSDELAAQLKDAVGTEGLLSIVGTYFERQSCIVRLADGSEVEIAADQGQIHAEATGLVAPILEIELELKAGSPTVLLPLGAQLAAQYPLQLESRSKYARGLELAGLLLEADDQKHSCAKQQLAGLACETLPAVMVEWIHRLVQAQAAFLTEPDEPETLHQLRVALRRLRSLLSFSKDLFPLEEYQTQQAALRQWGVLLGPLRETDVLLMEWELLSTTTFLCSPNNLALQCYLADTRSLMAQQLHSQVGNGQFTATILRFWAWLEAGRWLETAASLSTADLVCKRQQKWLRTILKLGRKVSFDNDTELHALRIQGKKLRYGLEALPALFPSEQAAVLLCLKKMQDDLGILHDTQIAEVQIAALLSSEAAAETAFEAGILRGWQTRQALAVRKKFPRRWKKFKKAVRKLLTALEERKSR